MTEAVTADIGLRAAALDTACAECDLLLRVPELPPGARAYCPRCGHLLTAHVKDGQERALAFAVAAAILLVLACSFPFLTFERAGLSNSTSLPGSGMTLFDEGAVALSAMVFGFILVIPSMLLAALVGLLVGIKGGRPRQPALILLGRAITLLSPWSMVEVFVIGVIVSLVKLASMATITLGISFWAYVGFAVCFTAAFATLDRHDLWAAIEGHPA